MEEYFPVMFEDLRLERSLFLLLSLTDPDFLRQSKITDFEIDIFASLASEKLHRQNVLEERLAMSFLQSQLE